MTYCEQKLELKPLETAFKNKYCLAVNGCFVICGLCHIRNVLIGVEYPNCHRTLDVYLLFAISMGQIQLKLINLWTGQFVIYKSVI